MGAFSCFVLVANIPLFLINIILSWFYFHCIKNHLILKIQLQLILQNSMSLIILFKFTF